MAKLLNKMLNFVGWEADDEDYEEDDELQEEVEQPQFINFNARRQQGKVVNMHPSNQFKVVIMQPERFEEAQDICDHLKSKKPIIINLEEIEKDVAQRIVDFLSGSVYALDGNIQKVSNSIFLIAPNNVDIMGDFNDEIGHRESFPWLK
jgi:cell division inhibitor SepF